MSDQQELLVTKWKWGTLKKVDPTNPPAVAEVSYSSSSSWRVYRCWILAFLLLLAIAVAAFGLAVYSVVRIDSPAPATLPAPPPPPVT